MWKVKVVILLALRLPLCLWHGLFCYLFADKLFSMKIQTILESVTFVIRMLGGCHACCILSKKQTNPKQTSRHICVCCFHVWTHWKAVARPSCMWCCLGNEVSVMKSGLFFLHSKGTKLEKLPVHVYEVDEEADKDEVSIWFLASFCCSDTKIAK